MSENLPPIFWEESPNYGPRNGAVSLIVLHDTEGSYEGAISWFKNPASQVSAHVVLSGDGTQATQMVRWSKKAWHVADFNDQSVGLEMAGFASKGYRSDELRRAARVVAYLLTKYRLPAVRVSEKGAQERRRGWTAHQSLGAAGGGHHDPGFSPAKLYWFGRLVKKEYDRGGFRDVWGVD